MLDSTRIFFITPISMELPRGRLKIFKGVSTSSYDDMIVIGVLEALALPNSGDTDRSVNELPDLLNGGELLHAIYSRR
jgi:hypothetical protein